MKTLKNLIYLAIATVIACLCIHEARAQQRGGKLIKPSDGIRAFGDLMITDDSQPVEGIHTYQVWKGSPESGSFYLFVSANAQMNDEFISATEYAYYHRGRMNDSALVIDGAPLDEITIQKQMSAFRQTLHFEADSLQELGAVSRFKTQIKNEKLERRKYFPFFSGNWGKHNRAVKKAKADLEEAMKLQNDGIARRARLNAEALSLLLTARELGYAALSNAGILPITEITANGLPTRISKGSLGQNPMFLQERVPQTGPSNPNQNLRRNESPPSRGRKWK